MKKIISICLIFACLSSVAQETKPQDNMRMGEIKLNALFLILGAFEIEYEQLINEESSYGVSLFLPIDSEIDINYYISPYYRLYFGNKRAAGFFIEGFGMLNSVDDYYYSGEPDFNETFETRTDFALGLGVGGKFITNRNFTAEIFTGVGRNFFNTNTNSNYEIIGKGGIKIGYRF
jgi:hypothetical protein